MVGMVGIFLKVCALKLPFLTLNGIIRGRLCKGAYTNSSFCPIFKIYFTLINGGGGGWHGAFVPLAMPETVV